MGKQRVRDLGVLLKVQDGRFLDRVFNQIKSLLARRTGHVVIECGKNSPSVVMELNKALLRATRGLLMPASANGIYETKTIKYELKWDNGDLALKNDVVLTLSDDLLIPTPTLRELRYHFGELRHRRIQARRLFCWDNMEHHNARIPESWPTVLLASHGPARAVKLKNPVLDMRYLTEEDRVFEEENGGMVRGAKSPPIIEEVKLGS